MAAKKPTTAKAAPARKVTAVREKFTKIIARKNKK